MVGVYGKVGYRGGGDQDGILKESHSEAVGKSVSQQSSQLLNQSANFSLTFQTINSKLALKSAVILDLNLDTFLIGVLIDSLTRNKHEKV